MICSFYKCIGFFSVMLLGWCVCAENNGNVVPAPAVDESENIESESGQYGVAVNWNFITKKAYVFSSSILAEQENSYGVMLSAIGEYKNSYGLFFPLLYGAFAENNGGVCIDLANRAVPESVFHGLQFAAIDDPPNIFIDHEIYFRHVNGGNFKFLSLFTNVNGFGLAPLIYGGTTNGVQISGLGFQVVNGVQIAGVFVGWGKGVHIAGVSSGYIEGLQVGIFTDNGVLRFTDAQDPRRLTIGVYNRASDCIGGQIGIYNSVKGASGNFQIGLLNYNEKAWIPYLPLFNWNF